MRAIRVASFAIRKVLKVFRKYIYIYFVKEEIHWLRFSGDDV